MKKTVYIGEDKLMNIKNAMADDNISRSTFMHEDTPPYEEDEFEIGGEGSNNDFFHINEISQDDLDFILKFKPNDYVRWVVFVKNGMIPKYFEKKSYAVDWLKWCKHWFNQGEIIDLNKYQNVNESNNLKYVDLSDVGLVEYEWYFDEDEYNEWLQDNELTDSDEVRNQYYKEDVTYGVEYYDNETFHYMESDQNLMYDELEDLFGEKMASQMLSNCIENGGGKFETYEIYEDNTYDISNPQELNDIAMKLFSHGEYYKDCRGFILSNGVIVYTPSEHNEICKIPGVNNKFDFIELGNIRLLPNSIDIGAKPTSEQEEILRHVIASYSDDELYLDIFDNHEEIGVKYVRPSWRYVIGEINRYYSEGIRPQGNEFYETKDKGKRLIVNEDQLLVLKENSFENWFGNSILKDEQGNPIKMYHGTDAEFNSFSKDFIGSTGSYEGYGFNFTPYESRARGYNSKNVIEAYLKVENPMTTKSNNISLNDLIKIIAELDEGKEYTDTIVAAYEPAGYGEKWDAAYYRRALPVAAKTIYQYNIESEYGDAGIYAEICINGNADKFKTIDVFEKLGYDSAIFYDNDGRINTVVVFEPNQIKRTSNKTFDMNSDIMDESLKSKNIIKESQESKSISAAKKLVMQRLGYDEKEADEFIRIKLRNDIPTLRTPQGGKFILGATRMFCDGELRSANDIGNLNSTLKLVASDAHINEYDRNLNNLSCQELIQRFAKAMSDNIEAEKDEVNQMVFDSPSDYEIVRIDSFEQAEEYGDYVSWCVTHDEEMFNSYAGNGINQFYFCLKNGFENVEEVQSEGCPLDEYGLSMIAVSVNENGMLNTCTCRWNHDNGGDDSVMNTKEISQVIGMNFFDVFKPNNKWKDVLSRLMQRLENGDNPNNVFNFVGRFSEGFAPVEISGKRNFINQEGKLLSDQWFDSAGMFSEGFATIKLNNKWNFINKEGKLLSDKWFEEVGVFSEGFATIRLNNNWNFINQEGKLLSDRWFDYANGFSEGFSSIGLDNKENFINQEGKLLSDQWFDDAFSFREGLAVVRIGYKKNFINQEGNLISDKWFDYASEFKEGFAVVILNKRHNFINQEGKLLSNKWFDDAADFSEGLANITLNKRHNFINQEGKLLSNQWFSYARNFSEGFAVVRLNKKDNFINQEGKLLSNQWFDSASNFNEGLAKIILNNKCNFINQECKILCNQWFDDAYDFFRGFSVVELNGKCNFISKEGNILSDQWFDSATYFDSNGFADVAINGNRYKIDTNGNLVLKESKNKRKNILVSENQLITLKENMETEVEASEVNLDSFKKNNELAPKMWDGFDLDPRARLKLLDIADDFWDFANISWVKPKGIHLTGSICNFNWSKYSDIDLHIVVDFSEIDERKDFVQEYFDAKKNEWNDEHSNLKIYDYPVELYVEDINAETESGGLYDLEENDWIKKPDKDNVKQIGLDKYEIKNEAAKLMTSIDDLCDEFDATDDDAKLREIGEKSHSLLKKIKNMRKLGLKRGGESDSFNIIYKVLRRAGYMDMLWDLSSSLYDKLNSIGINESISNDNEIFDLAKERFGVTHDIRECGYILPDGSMLDFSGRHMITGNTDASHLKGRRSVDHREIGDINWDDDMNTKTNVNINMPEFIRKGAIRIHCSNSWSSINLFTKPTKEQINPLLRLIQYSKGNVTVEIGDGDNSYEYAEWDDANPRRVINDVIRYFDGETVNLVGNVAENKIISAYYNKFIGINEEVVADGNADHNPFKQRWKRERDILKNYLCNYGEIMTSKENGKQYKVLYDTTLSSRLGINYCICIQWNPITMEPGNVIYVRAFDKFTRRIFRPQFDTRGFDNVAGTSDDVV